MPRKLRTIVKDLLIMAATGLATLIVMEVVVRFLPVADAPPVEPPTASNPVQRYVPNTAYTWSLGWNFYTVIRGRSNAQGFLADYDYDAKATTPLVAVVGDSMVEALHVSFADSITGRLQAMLGPRGRAYAIAQSGAPISQYVAYAHHACEVYKPQRLVVTVVGNDFDESVFTHRLRDGFFHLHERADRTFDYKLTPWQPPGLTERMFRRSALAHYLVRNVGLRNVANFFRPNAAQAEPDAERYVGMTLAAAPPERVDEGYRVIAWFLDALPREACLAPQNIVLAVDAPRPHIYEDYGRNYAHKAYFGLMRSRLISEAAARGFKVIDLEPVFLAAHQRDHRPFEYRTDPHWNPYAHEIVTAEVRKALGDWPPLSGTPMTQAGE